MASFNKVILLGNLTRDPELRMTANQSPICKIGIAVSRTYKDREGNQREDTAFVDVDAFGRQAEVISQYFNKGKPILVEGRLHLDQWESPTGEKRSKLKVILESFSFIGSRSDNGYNNSPYSGNGTNHYPTAQHQNPPLSNQSVESQIPPKQAVPPSPSAAQDSTPTPAPTAAVAPALAGGPIGKSPIDDDVPF